MRILLLPTISIAEVDRDSDFYWFKLFADVAIRKGDFVYMMLPKECEKFVKEEPGIKYLFFDDPEGFYYRMKNNPDGIGKMFSHGDGYYFADVAITSRNIVALSLASSLSARGEENFPTMVFENIVRPDFWTGFNKIPYALSHQVLPVWYCSEYEQRVAQSLYKPLLGRKDLSKDIVLGCGVDIEKLKTYTNVEKFPMFTVFYGGRINDDKNFDFILKVFEASYKSAKNIRFIVTTPHKDRNRIKEYRKRMPFVEFHVDTPRDLFYTLAAKSHVFICASKRESYSLGFTEQLYLTGMGIIKNSNWAKSVYGGLVDYFDTVDNAVGLLDYIQDGYDDLEGKIVTTRSSLEKDHNLFVNFDTVYQWVYDYVYSQPIADYKNVDDLRRTVSMMNKEFNFRTYIKNLPALIASIAQGSGRKGMFGYSPYSIYKLLMYNEIAYDKYDSEFPLMVRYD